MKKLFSLGIALFIVGCSNPSMDDAQKALSQYLDSESGGQIKLSSFKKTDGQSSEVMGVKRYNLIYEAEITFVSDGIWKSHMFWQPQLTFNFSKGGTTASGMNKEIAVHSGDHFKIGGNIESQKSENGWSYSVGNCQER